MTVKELMEQVVYWKALYPEVESAEIVVDADDVDAENIHTEMPDSRTFRIVAR